MLLRRLLLFAVYFAADVTLRVDMPIIADIAALMFSPATPFLSFLLRR